MTSDTDRTVETLLQTHAKRILLICGNNRTQAAAMMGISLRTMRNWIRKWRLDKEFPARSAPKPKI